MASPGAGGSELDGVGEGNSQTGVAGDERLTSAAHPEDPPPPPPPPRSTAVLSLQQHRRMVCAEHPCRVLNVGKMLETLGGEEGMSRTYADPSKRLELYFRPRDPYCHPVCGNRFPSTSMLLRVRRRVPKPRGQGVAALPAGDTAQQSQIDMEILGVICTTYKFQGLADFQYLAVHTEAEGTQSSMYNKILLQRPEKKEFFDQEMPLYIPPPIFSRLDNPVDYFYRPDIQHREGYLPPQLSSENLIGLSRARRPHNAIFVNFEDKAVPTEAMEAAVLNWKRVCSHPNEQQSEEELRQLFQSRPVWSRNAVKANLEIHPEKLKLLLPYVAYYMLTGPWRSLWVRFGYDPRKDPKAKAYQVLDFRIRCGMKHGYTPNDMPVKAKRSTYNYSLPITIKKSVPQPASLQEFTQGLTSSSTTSGRKPAPSRYKLKESAYVFREATLPPYRQMFYQLCDLKVERLTKIVHRNDGEESECTERDGWCLPKTNDELRDIMSSMIKQIIRSKRPALFPTKTKSSGKERGLLELESGEEEEEEEDEEEEEEFQPSEGSENEMETEILDYM
ncbi:general transcription factor 3C polypeptide 5-like isoform X1 [Acipenser oxyrinchus oxyrinchus]|uniref:General transcription factor 3C polypeptide 5 n=1 Tax=Acipenser oxyrinchus oxyrinchus TaxID=40147 RepID=A0AAD8CSH1_ACIOX|nr:general transcription factor 3C polypeptide 5-like isoform X1 [Acipenser oxyrinchus oxyrinchus]